MSVNAETHTPPLAGKRIIVAGAGIAGLSFVRALQRTWPEDTPRPHLSVYERDPRHLPPERGNYSLGLRSDSASRGLQALQKLDLINEAFAARAAGSEGTVLVRDQHWRTILTVKKQSPPDNLPCEHMRITRNGIRECLIQGTEGATEMHWEMACMSATTLPDGTVEVALSDGSKAVCDLLIVADGASSKLRKSLRPDDNLQYAGAVMIGGQATFPKDDMPRELRAGGGGPVLGGDGHGLVVFPTTTNGWVWFVTRRSPSPRMAIKGENNVKNQKEIAKEAGIEGKVFGEPLDRLLAASDPDSLKTINAQDKAPIEHKQVEANPYIFIGDSNHAVSPFAGNGANMALVDGVSLAEALCTSSTLDTAAQKFDKESIPRCKATVKKSHMIIALTHTTGWRFQLVVILLRVMNFLFMR